jgi:hypothetical protein
VKRLCKRGNISTQLNTLLRFVSCFILAVINMSDSEGSNFTDNESEMGSNQQSDSDVEVSKRINVPYCYVVLPAI